jgi:outer membrane lipoprotein SlyB
VGAIIGAAIGGKKGAAIGTMAGAAGGAGVVQAGGRNDAVFAAGTPLTLRLTQPITVMVERNQDRVQ